VASDVDVEWSLSGRGWAECGIRVGEREGKWLASFIAPDCLADLTTATAALLEGCTSFEVRFEEEPQVVVLTLVRHGELVALNARRFADRPTRARTGELVLDAQCSLVRFARALSRALARLLSVQGADGYRAQWANAAFPTQEHERLKQAIRRVQAAT
jgi:hypothetical protein